MEYRNLQDVKLPVLGFGTWELKGLQCQKAVEKALDTGYRHIDTARIYQNEHDVGNAIQSSGIQREDLFVTSKAWQDDFSPEGIHNQVDQSLEELKLDYLDMYLLHWPSEQFSHKDALEALAEEKGKGRIRHIGVSNFSPSQMEEANSVTRILSNQIKYHPFQEQEQNCGAARRLGIYITAYSPLEKGGVFKNPLLQEMGNKYNVSPAQIALRWLVQQENVIAIPRSKNPDHIESNFQIFDFKLTDEDMEKIFDLAKNSVK